MIIIPAIDIMQGKCVRLTQGDYARKTIYSDDPLEIAKQFEDAGIKRLHLVDLDGARNGIPGNWKTLESIAAQTELQIDFSGGIHSQEMVNEAFNTGAWYVTLGSIAVRNEILVSQWIKAHGGQRFIIAADVIGEKVMIKGWTEQTDLLVYDLIERYSAKGIQQFMCTDIAKDGMLDGPSADLYKKIKIKHKNIDLIASGGISGLKDIRILEEIGCSAAIIGKAIYENKIMLKDIC